MKKIVSLIAALLCAAVIYAEESEPKYKYEGYKQAETEHFRFIYEPAAKEHVEAFAKNADESWNKIAAAYGFPPEKVDVVFNYNTNVCNAFATSFGMTISLFDTPPRDPDFGFRDEWRKLFLMHELVHISNFSFETDPKMFNYLGRFFQTFDSIDLPIYALEGLTTVLETELSNGGRGRSPYFELSYKVPALEGSFVPFKEIGSELEPPYGQGYVFGYVMSRYIADKFGVSALADIERNRQYMGKWDDAVKKRTGMTIDEIYRDIKIVLEKRYSAERHIKEGVIISPRTVNVNYYRPAFIKEDGSVIGLRSASGKRAAAVEYNPGDGEEKILFEGPFSDDLSFTYAENGFAVAALNSTILDTAVQFTGSSDLYTWTEEKGLKQLTKGKSLFQPSLSKDASRLVAIEENHLNYRIMEVDLSTGSRTCILEENGVDFIEPCLNKDGSKLAFMAALKGRAAIGVYDFAEKKLQYVYNFEGNITDPAYPVWNVNEDGSESLLFCDNARGRLEVYECTSAANGSFSAAVPVLADPAGVLWAQKCSKGIYYWTEASSGLVIKAKPADEWKSVPDFNGPSMPGEVVCFGKDRDDYPDYVPFEKKLEFTKRDSSLEEKAAALKAPESTAESIVDSTDGAFDLKNEKRYFDVPKLTLALPFVSSVTKENNEELYGYGAFSVLSGSMLQMGYIQNLYYLDFVYFPDFENFAGTIGWWGTLLNGDILLYAGQGLISYTDGEYSFVQNDYFTLSYSFPFYNRAALLNYYDFSFLLSATGSLSRSSNGVFGFNSDIAYDKHLSLFAGPEFYTSIVKGDNSLEFYGNLLAYGVFADSSKYPAPAFPLYEGTFVTEYNKGKFKYTTGLKWRWFDLPSNSLIPDTLVNLRNRKLSCEYPGRVIPEVTIGYMNNLFDFRVFAEYLFSFGQNSYTDTSNELPFELWFYSGFELYIPFQRQSLMFGLSVPVLLTGDIFTDGIKFHMGINLDGLKTLTSSVLRKRF